MALQRIHWKKNPAKTHTAINLETYIVPTKLKPNSGQIFWTTAHRNWNPSSTTEQQKTRLRIISSLLFTKSFLEQGHKGSQHAQVRGERHACWLFAKLCGWTDLRSNFDPTARSLRHSPSPVLNFLTGTKLLPKKTTAIPAQMKPT